MKQKFEHSGKGDLTIHNNITGDLSTSAAQRFHAAVEIVAKECSENLARLWPLLPMLEQHPPVPFRNISPRRINETAPAYAERSRLHYRSWLENLEQPYRLAIPIQHQYLAHKLALSHGSLTPNHFDNCYQEFQHLHDH